MSLTIEMFDPQGQILMELEGRYATQSCVAITYAFIIVQKGDKANWAAINAAIRNHWKSKVALERIKKLAWKQVAEWQARR